MSMLVALYMHMHFECMANTGIHSHDVAVCLDTHANVVCSVGRQAQEQR